MKAVFGFDRADSMVAEIFGVLFPFALRRVDDERQGPLMPRSVERPITVPFSKATRMRLLVRDWAQRRKESGVTRGWQCFRKS